MVELSEGEVICPVCKGSGSNEKTNSNNCSFHFICLRCNGTGKLDWISRAMAPKEPNPYDSITIPLLRRHYPKLIAEELFGVQPIEKPEMWEAFKKDES